MSSSSITSSIRPRTECLGGCDAQTPCLRFLRRFGRCLLHRRWEISAQAPSSPAFEVASVRLNTSGENRALFGNAPGGRFNATNVPLRSLIAAAYGSPQPLPNFRIVGGPSWMDSDRFDIVAKAADDSQPGAPDNVFMMLRTLLIERFTLVTHRETRELMLYELVLARSDKKLGPQLRPTAVDCVPARRGGPPPASQPNGARPAGCSVAWGVSRVAAQTSVNSRHSSRDC